jgi:hypothetical protein
VLAGPPSGYAWAGARTGHGRGRSVFPAVGAGPSLTANTHATVPDFDYTLSGLVRGWVRMAPALLVTWLVAAAPAGPVVREVFVAGPLSIFVVVSAAKARRLHGDRPVPVVGLERLVSHAINVLMFLLIFFLAAGLGATLGGMVAEAAGVPRLLTTGPAMALATVPLMYWFWPVMVLAGVAPDEAGHRSGRSWIWWGPGYRSARRLLASFGSGRRTALILGIGYLWLAVAVAAARYPGSDSFPALAEVASYGIFLPLWTWVATVETHRLVQAVLDGRVAPEADP